MHCILLVSLIEIRKYADRLFVIVGILRFIVFRILREMYISVERLFCIFTDVLKVFVRNAFYIMLTTGRAALNMI